MTETKSESKSESKAKVYLVSVPGTNGGSVVHAKNKQDAANQYALSAGLQPVNDEKGKDQTAVAVLEFDTVQVDYDEVNKLANPDKE